MRVVCRYLPPNPRWATDKIEELEAKAEQLKDELDTAIAILRRVAQVAKEVNNVAGEATALLRNTKGMDNE